MAFGFGAPSEEYKLVVLVRTDLDMGKGKIAAQVGHASVECALRAEKKDKRAFDIWMNGGQKKVVLKVVNKDEMVRYMSEAKSRGLYACMITDAGRTEVEPGTNTCVGIGPAPGSEIDRVTGGLKMLRSRSAFRCACRRHSRARPHPQGSAGARVSAGPWT